MEEKNRQERNNGVRINKYLSEAGVCSRREADRLVEAGQVQVDGVNAVAGTKVLPGQKVVCRGRAVEQEKEWILLAVNKPKGITCTTADPNAETTIVDFVNYGKRIYPVGRLDKDSEGLILMTNDGELMEKILRGKNGHEKEYVVTVNRPVTPEFIESMQRGVYLPELNQTTRPCFAEAVGKRTFRIILTQGLNRQIRRMCKELGYRVADLKRIRIMNIKLGDLPTGKWRAVTEEEKRELMRLTGSEPAGKQKNAGVRGERENRKPAESQRRTADQKLADIRRQPENRKPVSGQRTEGNRGDRQRN